MQQSILHSPMMTRFRRYFSIVAKLSSSWNSQTSQISWFFDWLFMARLFFLFFFFMECISSSASWLKKVRSWARQRKKRFSLLLFHLFLIFHFEYLQFRCTSDSIPSPRNRNMRTVYRKKRKPQIFAADFVSGLGTSGGNFRTVLARFSKIFEKNDE